MHCILVAYAFASAQWEVEQARKLTGEQVWLLLKDDLNPALQIYFQGWDVLLTEAERDALMNLCDFKEILAGFGADKLVVEWGGSRGNS